MSRTNRVSVTILTHGTAFLSVRDSAEIMFHEDDIETIVAALRDAKAARDAVSSDAQNEAV